MEYTELHGHSAQSRRQSTVGNSSGVTLADIQEHVLSRVPGLKQRGISRITIHELMVPPRHNTRNAQRYHSLVDVRVPGKSNKLRRDHQDAHYCFAQVRYVREFAQLFPGIVELSCDNKNKMNVGTLAVSRYGDFPCQWCTGVC